MAVTFGAGCAVAAVVAGVRTLWAGGVVVGPGSWSLLVLLAIPSLWSIVLPAVGAVGTVAAMSRWVDEGAWIGARSVGVRGRTLLPAVLVLGAALGTATAVMTLYGEPLVKRTSARVINEAAADVSLWPGELTDLGPVVVRPERRDKTGYAEALFIAGDGLVGTAQRGRVVRRGEQLAVELIDGSMVFGSGDVVRVEFDRWVRELPAPGSRRLELDQRTNAELAAAATRTQQSGGGASYEWAILYKRYLHPIAALLFPLALLPAGASGRRPAASAALACVGYLVAVRFGDHLATVVGPWLGAATGPLFVALWAAVAWARWADR